MLAWTIGVVDTVRAVLGSAVPDGDTVFRSIGLRGAVLAGAGFDNSGVLGGAVQEDGTAPGAADLGGADDAAHPVHSGGMSMSLEPDVDSTSISTKAGVVLLADLQEPVAEKNWKGERK